MLIEIVKDRHARTVRLTVFLPSQATEFAIELGHRISPLRRPVSGYNLHQVISDSQAISHELQPLPRRSNRQGIGSNGQEAGRDAQRVDPQGAARMAGQEDTRQSRLAIADPGVAAQLRASLNSQGTPIGAYDLLLAACALRRGLRIVTHNAREFVCVGGLGLEDWHSR